MPAGASSGVAVVTVGSGAEGSRGWMTSEGVIVGLGFAGDVFELPHVQGAYQDP